MWVRGWKKSKSQLQPLGVFSHSFYTPKLQVLSVCAPSQVWALFSVFLLDQPVAPRDISPSHQDSTRVATRLPAHCLQAVVSWVLEKSRVKLPEAYSQFPNCSRERWGALDCPHHHQPWAEQAGERIFQDTEERRGGRKIKGGHPLTPPSEKTKRSLFKHQLAGSSLSPSCPDIQS